MISGVTYHFQDFLICYFNMFSWFFSLVMFTIFVQISIYVVSAGRAIDILYLSDMDPILITFPSTVYLILGAVFPFRAPHNRAKTISLFLNTSILKFFEMYFDHHLLLIIILIIINLVSTLCWFVTNLFYAL